MTKLYTTKEVAKLFEVKNETVSYWKMYNKLPMCGIVEHNGSYLYSEQDIVSFIIDTHLGKYKNSSIDVVRALERMGLADSVILPETNRFRSIYFDTDLNHIYKIKSNKYVLNFNTTEHIDCTSRSCYITAIAALGIQPKGENVVLADN